MSMVPMTCPDFSPAPGNHAIGAYGSLVSKSTQILPFCKTINASRGYFDDFIKKVKVAMTNIDTFEDLASNWNGYGASVIDSNSISFAKKFLQGLSVQSDGIQSFPVPNGNVQIDISLPDRMVEIEFQHDSCVVLSKNRTTDEEIEKEFNYSTNTNFQILKLIS